MLLFERIAARALFKVTIKDDRVKVKVSQGFVNVERFDEVRKLSASQMVELGDSDLSNVRKFNPLTEIW